MREPLAVRRREDLMARTAELVRTLGGSVPVQTRRWVCLFLPEKKRDEEEEEEEEEGG